MFINTDEKIDLEGQRNPVLFGAGIVLSKEQDRGRGYVPIASLDGQFNRLGALGKPKKPLYIHGNGRIVEGLGDSKFCIGLYESIQWGLRQKNNHVLITGMEANTGQVSLWVLVFEEQELVSWEDLSYESSSLEAQLSSLVTRTRNNSQYRGFDIAVAGLLPHDTAELADVYIGEKPYSRPTTFQIGVSVRDKIVPHVLPGLVAGIAVAGFFGFWGGAQFLLSEKAKPLEARYALYTQKGGPSVSMDNIAGKEAHMQAYASNFGEHVAWLAAISSVPGDFEITRIEFVRPSYDSDLWLKRRDRTEMVITLQVAMSDEERMKTSQSIISTLAASVQRNVILERKSTRKFNDTDYKIEVAIKRAPQEDMS